MRLLASIIVTVLLVGCVTLANKINHVKIGMTRDEVIAVMGTPVSTSAINKTEYLNYALFETPQDAGRGQSTPYYVRIVNDHVDAFGRHGDFDSTKTPTIRIEKDEIIKQDATVKMDEKPDLYREMLKLKDLKEQGILTQEEFESKKKEMLNRY